MLGNNILNFAREALFTFRGSMFVTQMSRGLWEKKKFRVYREFTGATAIKFVITKNFILTLQDLQLDAGAVKVQILSGATEAGVFTPVTTKFCMNTVGGDVPGNCVVSAGGTLTGGVEREVLRANAGGGQGAGRPGAAGARVLSAGTYYMNLTVTGTTSGVYALEWEELD